LFSLQAEVLTAEKWKQVDKSVEKALAWLMTQQQADGSFKAVDLGQPAITSFGLMAFLAQGESPVDGRYQQQLTKAVDFIAAQQKASGLIGLSAPNASPMLRVSTITPFHRSPCAKFMGNADPNKVKNFNQ